MTAKAFAAIAAAIVVAAFSMPGAAPARTAPRRENPTITETLYLQGTHGYSLEVTLVNHQALAVGVYAPSTNAIVITSYRLRAPQDPASDNIRASLGKLGHIDMRFIPESVHQVKPEFPLCKGERETEYRGRFVGSVEFRGERGYTRARATRGHAFVSVSPAPTCGHNKGRSLEQGPPQGPHERGPRQRKSAEGEPMLLGLTAKREHPSVEFKASQLVTSGKKLKGLAFGNFSAIASRDRGRIKEVSGALDLLVGGNHLEVPDLAHPTREATIEPPAPFLGEATFQRESTDQTSFTGDLRVNLPGFGVVPLAGPGIEATMCSGLSCLPKKLRRR